MTGSVEGTDDPTKTLLQPSPRVVVAQELKLKEEDGVAQELKLEVGEDLELELALQPDEHLPHEAEAFNASVFSLLLANIVQDFTRLTIGNESKFLRASRLTISMAMVLVLMGLQAFLLVSVNNLLCKAAVKNIREIYSDYEVHMYNNHTVQLWTGFYRGIPGHFDPKEFSYLSAENRETLCQIPLAHPKYIAGILLVWTLTCLIELREIITTTIRVLFATPTVACMSRSLRSTGTPHEVEVVGLTLAVKVIIGVIVFLPRYICTGVLIWLGCRWLTATPNLGDVLLNGLALEFILMLKSLLFESFASKRSRLVVERTKFQPLDKHESATHCSFFGSISWVVLAVIFVYLYVFYLQQVLPDYRWDVNAVCAAMRAD